MLKTLTVKTTQQHIHPALIEKIAYQLEFEHPQSFNKLFKQRTSVSPVQFQPDQLNLN